MLIPQRYPLIGDLGFPNGLAAARQNWAESARRERKLARLGAIGLAVGLLTTPIAHGARLVVAGVGPTEPSTARVVLHRFVPHDGSIDRTWLRGDPRPRGDVLLIPPPIDLRTQARLRLGGDARAPGRPR